MINSPLYAVTVPGFEDSLTIVEGLCETFIAETAGLSAGAILMLRLAVAEACMNAIRQEPIDGRLRVVRVAFYRMRESNPGSLALEISDPGRGLEVSGALPPYGDGLVGHEVGMFRVVDHRLIARVKSPFEARLRAREFTEAGAPIPRESLLTAQRPRGLGLLALCRGWQRVIFRYHPDEGNTVRLEGPRLED